ncbi:ABC transporter ATP-binding protein [Limobrevibacterium gyesilva]|uniref:ABC transporter ATP-binding protein n=1 Tax=Limobrevibacterium gyesilva TaxID=2991712 RepID=A0AA41YJS0_9PROT|nr:ABC transporter ATP-binding protein [Limobrevibacterium gyesilva]MCW3473591.1 ABC transporter ATP-binding protein [Limobrevibacterium gyesilva]
MTPLLQVEDLRVRFRTDTGIIPAVNGVSFVVRPRETLALVGESGSGKSVTGLSIMRLTPRGGGCRVEGRIRFGAADLLALPEEDMRAIRGNRISMIFQEPMTSLNPVKTVGEQIAEAIRCHRQIGRQAALDRAAELLHTVGIPDARQRLASYPHHMSGGMRQRVMIAMALSCEPDLLIADEPTTALDVTVQAQIVELLKRLQQQTGMSVIFITHNLGVVADIADRVMVMYAGRIVEQAGTVPLLTSPLMPYTQGLLRSVPRLPAGQHQRRRLDAIPGNVPDPAELPAGCSFRPRCPHAVAGVCDTTLPELEDTAPGHLVRCRRWRDIAPAGA